ncbi:MAG: PLDc N-terminal domain-containing protein [Ktedonobacteraceae bacterium]|nr:PLDc N-terminal domain-containing protein [Ktedonobacteraceae bacterium]
MPVGFHSFELIILLIILGVIIAVTIFWIWMLVDCATNKRISSSQKLLWILAIVFTHLLGAILYFFLGRSARQPQIAYQPDMQPQAPRAAQAPYYPYQGGYQASQPMPPSYQADPMPPSPRYEQPSVHDYEQPQAMYPHEQNNE